MSIKQVFELHKIIFIVVIFTSLIGCSSADNFISKYGDSINIDGIQNDWNGNLSSIEDANLAVGFKNDDKNLYIILVTGDRLEIMKILRNGLTIWLTPSKDEKSLGIRYPLNLGIGENELNIRMMNDKNNKNEDPDNIVNKLLMEQKNISIVNEDGYPFFSFNLESREEFDAKLGYSFGQFVYELKVPLANNNNTEIYFDAMPGDEITVGFETEKPERKEKDNGSIRPSPGTGGMGRNQSPGVRRSREGKISSKRNINQMMDPIEFSCKVKLGLHQ